MDWNMQKCDWNSKSLLYDWNMQKWLWLKYAEILPKYVEICRNMTEICRIWLKYAAIFFFLLMSNMTRIISSWKLYKTVTIKVCQTKCPMTNTK